MVWLEVTMLREGLGREDMGSSFGRKRGTLKEKAISEDAFRSAFKPRYGSLHPIFIDFFFP